MRAAGTQSATEPQPYDPHDPARLHVRKILRAITESYEAIQAEPDEILRACAELDRSLPPEPYDIEPTGGIPASLARVPLQRVDNPGTPAADVAEVAGWDVAEVERSISMKA